MPADPLQSTGESLDRFLVRTLAPRELPTIGQTGRYCIFSHESAESRR